MSITPKERGPTQSHGTIRLSDGLTRGRRNGPTVCAIPGACASTRKRAQSGLATTARIFGKQHTFSGAARITAGVFMKEADTFLQLSNRLIYSLAFHPGYLTN